MTIFEKEMFLLLTRLNEKYQKKLFTSMRIYLSLHVRMEAVLTLEPQSTKKFSIEKLQNRIFLNCENSTRKFAQISKFHLYL